MITVTEKALKEIKRLRTENPAHTNAMIRVSVIGGGCSGMSYKLDFDTKDSTTADKVFEFETVKIAIDSKSFLYLTFISLQRFHLFFIPGSIFAFLKDNFNTDRHFTIAATGRCHHGISDSFMFRMGGSGDIIIFDITAIAGFIRIPSFSTH